MVNGFALSNLLTICSIILGGFVFLRIVKKRLENWERASVLLQICAFICKIVGGVEGERQEAFWDSGNGRRKKNRNQF